MKIIKKYTIRNIFIKNLKKSAVALKLLNIIKSTKLIINKMPVLFAISKIKKILIKLQVVVVDQYIKINNKNYRVIDNKNRVRLIRSG